MGTRNIGFENGWYGRYKKQKDDFIFTRVGKFTELVDICEDIQTDIVYLKLQHNYLGKPKTAYIERGALTIPATAEKLTNLGFDVTKKNFDAFVDSIFTQEDDFAEQNFLPTPVYTNLGWIELKDEDNNTNLFYRADTLIGASEGSYIGDFDVRKRGTFDAWKHLVENDIIGHDVLELVLIAALSAVVNGLLAPHTNAENPILHLNAASSKGKSTAGYLACSVVGKPFEGMITEIDEDGVFREYASVYQSWGATDNALITSQAGNRGVVTVLNELGKNFSHNMARLIFDMSEGSDKKRSTTKLTQQISERFSTVFISTGETSLIDKCPQKLEGIAVRVLEVNEKITDSADHSNRIKEICRENCGYAAPMLAEYIIDKGGIDYLLPIYKDWLNYLREEFPDTPNKDRFVEKFAALFMTTAEVSSEALKIAFNLEGIQHFLLNHEITHGKERNVALLSYQKIIEECRIHSNNFYTLENTTPSGKIYGRFCKRQKTLPNGKQATEEVLIRKPFLEEILKKYGFQNVDTCKAAWDNEGVLNRDKDRYTRTRKVEDGAADEEVYCFWIFDSKESVDIENIPKKSVKPKLSNREILIHDDEGGEEDDDLPFY